MREGCVPGRPERLTEEGSRQAELDPRRKRRWGLGDTGKRSGPRGIPNWVLLLRGMINFQKLWRCGT